MIDSIKKQEYCRHCDGCGWVEGGPTLQTICSFCDGEAIITTETKIKVPKPKSGRFIDLYSMEE